MKTLIVDSKIKEEEISDKYYFWHEQQTEQQILKMIAGDSTLQELEYKECKAKIHEFDNTSIVFKNKQIDEIFKELIRAYKKVLYDLMCAKDQIKLATNRHQKICDYFGEDLGKIDKAIFDEPSDTPLETEEKIKLNEEKLRVLMSALLSEKEL